MSSWATLECTDDEETLSLNYTHNCNGLAAYVIEERWCKHHGSWWQILNGMTAKEGAAFLDMLVAGIAMMPDEVAAQYINGGGSWGDKRSFMKHLYTLSVASHKAGSSGRWRTSG
jgi:uncharacterized protein YfaT (DUF1175 family)